MSDLISIFNMKEISVDTRIKILLKMVNIINAQYGSNIAEPIVYELIKQLNPDFVFNKQFLLMAGVMVQSESFVKDGQK